MTYFFTRNVPAEDPISRGRRKLNVFYWNLWEIQAHLLLLIEIWKSDQEKHSLTTAHVSTVNCYIFSNINFLLVMLDQQFM